MVGSLDHSCKLQGNVATKALKIWGEINKLQLRFDTWKFTRLTTYVFYNETTTLHCAKLKITVLASSIKQIMHNLFYWHFKLWLHYQAFTGVHHAIRFRITWAIKCTLVFKDFPMKMYSSHECIQPPLAKYYHYFDSKISQFIYSTINQSMMWTIFFTAANEWRKCNISCNMGTCDLPEMYVLALRPTYITTLIEQSLYTSYA